MALQVHMFGQGGDGFINQDGSIGAFSNGYVMLIHWNDSNNNITQFEAAIAGQPNSQGVQPSLIFHADDPSTGFVFDKTFLPNADGSVNDQIFNIPGGDANIFSLTTLASGKVIIVPNSTTFEFILMWPNN